MQPLESRTYRVPVVLRVLAGVLAVAMVAGGGVAFVQVRLLGVWAMLIAGFLVGEVLARVPWVITVRGDGGIEAKSLRGTRVLHVTEIADVGVRPLSIVLRVPDGRVWAPVRRARSLARDLASLHPALAPTG